MPSLMMCLISLGRVISIVAARPRAKPIQSQENVQRVTDLAPNHGAQECGVITRCNPPSYSPGCGQAAALITLQTALIQSFSLGNTIQNNKK